MSKVDFSLSGKRLEWAKAVVREGEFDSLAAYVDSLLDGDRERREEHLEWLQAEIDKGLASPLCDKDAFEVLDEVMARNRATGG